MLIVSRRRATAAGHSHPAAINPCLAYIWAPVLSIMRKFSYSQYTPTKAQFWIQVPPTGTIILILAYLGFILALEFVNNKVLGAQYYTALGIRAGWLAIAQTPLLILLAGKNNLIGLVTGVTYERLNVLHRWVARGFLLLATVHFGIQNIGWSRFGLRTMEWNTDTCPPTGIAAYALLLWLNISTLAPFRNLHYEIFVVQHLVTFFGFIIAIMYHLPSTALYTRVYVSLLRLSSVLPLILLCSYPISNTKQIWIPIGLYLFDRVFRTARSLWNNVPPSRAVLQTSEGLFTRVLITNSRIRNWAPGSHVLLSIPRYGIGQSHPATIFSTPTSHNGDLLFLLRARGGFTQRLACRAKALQMVLEQSPSAEKLASEEEFLCVVDGPYGGCQADLASYETLLMLAGSTGVTFALSILLDLAGRVQIQKFPIRNIAMVWSVKGISHTKCVLGELEAALGRLQAAGIEIQLKVFITGDINFSSSNLSPPGPGGSQIETAATQSCCYSPESEQYGTVPIDGAHSRHGSARKATLDSCLDCATTEYGRPDIQRILTELSNKAAGEMGVAVCGPLGMNAATRRAVAKLQSHKSGSQSIYLHVEGFSW